jgi:hypothetical protein
MALRGQSPFTQFAREDQLCLEPTDDQTGDAGRLFGERACLERCQAKSCA